jgi:hypothetical protein
MKMRKTRDGAITGGERHRGREILDALVVHARDGLVVSIANPASSKHHVRLYTNRKSEIDDDRENNRPPDAIFFSIHPDEKHKVVLCIIA